MTKHFLGPRVLEHGFFFTKGRDLAGLEQVRLGEQVL